MPPTLAQLVADPVLDLSVLAGADRLETVVRWVHVSELDDPTPYMEGGELLLTTGLGFRSPVGPRAAGAQSRQMAGYVARLVAANVAGLGFGIGLAHRAVPAALRRACADAGLPLLVVPQPVPFLAISKAVASAVAREQYETLAAAYDAQHALTRAALEPDGLAAVVTTLARLIHGWAVLTDAGGRPTQAQPAAAAQRIGALAGEFDRLRPHGPRSSAALADGGREVVIQGLGAGRRLRGFLVAGSENRLSAGDRTVITLAVPLVSLALERSRQLAGVERALRAAVLGLALGGHAGAVRTTADALVGVAGEAWQVALVGAVRGDPGDALVAALEDALPPALLLRDAATVVVAAPVAAWPHPEGSGPAAEPPSPQRSGPAAELPAGSAELPASRSGSPAVDALGTLLAHRPDLVAGVSSPRPFAVLAAARDEASRALAVARRGERRLLHFADIGHGGLLGLLDDAAVRAYADSLLAPLAGYGAQARGSLVESLRVWLAHNGQWDTAAAELGVHRHTLRYRMGRVERLLDRTLSDAGTRMELWLALSVAARPTPATARPTRATARATPATARATPATAGATQARTEA